VQNDAMILPFYANPDRMTFSERTGHISKDNRMKLLVPDGFRMHEFKCAACGFTGDADLNASRNIALKWLWRHRISPALRKTTFKEVPENKNFSHF
jgi:transposase